MLPGWNSVGSAGWWSAFFFWASIGSLMLLGVTEVLSHRYGVRKDELATKQQEDAEQAHQDEIARLRLETEIAKRDAAKANESAAQAQLAAERERGARVQLEEKLSPRALTVDQREALRARWAAFAEASVDIVVYPVGTTDISPLTDIISSILKNAHWTVRQWTSLSGQYVVGVGVAVRAGSNQRVETEAHAIVDGLNAIGIVAARTGPLTTDDFPMPAVGPPPVGRIAPIRIYIGTKP